MMKKLIILLFTIFLSVGCGKKDSNNTQSVEKTRLAADQGDAEAQFNLGRMYDEGQGVPQDYAEAMKWYRLAADQGYASAQNSLGSMYQRGEGVPQDYAQAVKWFRLAADQGDALAQFNLGRMYDKGQGVTQDDAQAMKWIGLAADQWLAAYPEAIEPRATERRAKFPGYWAIIGLLAALLVSRLFRTRYKPKKEKE